MGIVTQIKAPGAKVVALSEKRDIFMVLDHRNHSIGTGTREVCEFLAELISRSSGPRMEVRPEMLRPVSSVRSAIHI